MKEKIVVSGMKDVDLVIPFIDDDGSACDAIDMCLQIYDLVIFCNGGDRNDANAPEWETFKDEEEFILDGQLVAMTNTIAVLKY